MGIMGIDVCSGSLLDANVHTRRAAPQKWNAYDVTNWTSE